MTLQEILTIKEDQVKQFDNCIKGPYPDKEWARKQHELFRTEVLLVRDFISGKTPTLQLPKCLYVTVGICILDHEDIRGDCFWKTRPCPYRYNPPPKQGQFI